MALKPVVDRLEQELGDQLVVLRVDIQSSLGGELAELYGARFTPSFVFFNAQGEVAWFAEGNLDTDRVRKAVSP